MIITRNQVTEVTATINPSSHAKASSPSKATAVERIHIDLDEMVSRLRSEIWLGGILAIGAATMTSLLLMLVIDAVFQPESGWLRVALWFPIIGVVGFMTRHFVMSPLKQKCDRLAMAWALEQKSPAIEERITTSLQLSENPNVKTSSIIEAVAQQAHGSLAGCQEEDLRGQESFKRIIVATACLATFVLAMWIWRPYLIPSLQNLLNPWSTRVLPYLDTTIVPGNTHVAEGGDLGITAKTNHDSDAVLEIIENDVVIASHQMATQQTGGTVEFTLTGLKRDRQYRIRAGGLFSDRYQIFVDPKPVMKNSQVNVTFPEYTQLPPQVINDPAEPIEAIRGARIQIDADIDSTVPAAESSLRINGTSVPSEEVVLVESSGLWRHTWEFAAAAGEWQSGTISFVSEAGVRSDPFHFDVRALPDLPPSIAIDQPALSEIIAKADQSIHVDYHAADDFGVGALHLNLQKNSEPPSTKELPRDLQAEFVGKLSIELDELELIAGDQLTVWLSISDNRPDEYGGSQSVGSRKIHLQIAEDSIPVGQQVVRNEEHALLTDLAEAVQNLRQAAALADGLQSKLRDGEERLDTSEEMEEKSKQLQDQIKDAEHTLRRLSEQDEPTPQRLFQAEIERIQEVAKNDVAEARKQSGLIPLFDEPAQQHEAIAATKKSLNDAIDKLEQVRADVEDRSEQLERAAQLGELARQQERLAQNQNEGKANTPEVQKQQQQVADELQKVVEQDLDAKSEQFAQRADEAAKLKEEAANLQQQQKTLAKIDQVHNKEERDDKLLEMIAREQEQIAGETRMLETQQRNIQLPAADPWKQDQEKPNETVNAEQKENPAALAEARKQMEAVPGKLRQKELKQAEVDARRAGELLQEEANSVPEKVATKANANEDNAKQKKSDLERLAKQQERVRDAIEAVREDHPEEAVAKLQEQIANRTERLRDKADELLQLPTEDPENQKAVREARKKIEQAMQETKAAEELVQQQQKQAGNPKRAADPEQATDPKQTAAAKQTGDPKQAAEQKRQAAKSLEEATQSLDEVCKSCKKCSRCNKPGGSTGSSGSSPKRGGVSSKPGDSKPREKSGESGSPSTKQQQLDSQQLAETADKAHQTARNPSPIQTQELAQELNQLADRAAQRAGRPGRKNSKQQDGQSKSNNSSDSGQQAGGPQPGSPPNPQGVNGNAGADQSEVAPTQLRGRSTSNWTQTRRKLKNNLLDDQDSKVPEEFRSVVRDYFEQLSRLKSRQDTAEKQE
ncbi:MAG: DUF4175 family protein [Rubripirellula sp.]